jgi:glycosyltransferase involved in cell wall biosynthesis
MVLWRAHGMYLWRRLKKRVVLSKIAEAMAMGMAIVSTPQGMRGFSLVNGESVLIAHNEEQFASHVVALLRDQARRRSLGAAAREVALSTIDWPVLGKRLVGIIHSVKEEWGTG